MRAGIAEAWPLVLAALSVLALVLLAVHRMRRARLRQRIALGETGLHLAFDACAPEGAMVSFDDFPVGRLRGESLEPPDKRRR
ncbi:MAG: hypothetical protein ACXWC4_18500 [Telluria sp.]